MPASLSSPEDTAHLWLCDPAAVDDALLRRYLTLLAPDELERLAQFRTHGSRVQYLVTRALLRSVLSRYFSIPPTAWRFSRNAGGRPAIHNREAAGIDFNISHTGSRILLGIAADVAIGVDIEHCRRELPALKIADRFFSPAEADYLRACGDAERLEQFFRFWTLKESYAKAHGLGLSLPLDEISFRRLCEARLIVSAHDAASWRFWQYRPDNNYVVAICLERKTAKAPSILQKTIVPFVTESSFVSILAIDDEVVSSRDPQVRYDNYAFED
jgi:4'-phosphopantetheinyl transferase